MNRSRSISITLRSITAMSLALMLPGGCVEMELRMTNHVGGPVDVYSGHTQKSVRIENNATATVPHTAGLLSIGQRDEVWRYDDVSVDHFLPDLVHGIQRLTLPLTVNTDGTLTTPSGKKIEPTSRSYH